MNAYTIAASLAFVLKPAVPFAIVQFMFAQDMKSGWQSIKGIKKPLFISYIKNYFTFDYISGHYAEINNKNICIK